MAKPTLPQTAQNVQCNYRDIWKVGYWCCSYEDLVCRKSIKFWILQKLIKISKSSTRNKMYQEFICSTLRSWLHKISTRIRVFSPGFENNRTLKCWFGNFPTSLYISGSMEKCQINISRYRYSPIQGRRS